MYNTEQACTIRLTDLGKWSGWNVAGDVVEVDVSTQQLFLPERLIAVVARVRLLAGVCEDVTLQVTLVQRRVRTQLTAETLLTIVRLQVNLHESSTIRTIDSPRQTNVMHSLRHDAVHSCNRGTC